MKRRQEQNNLFMQGQEGNPMDGGFDRMGGGMGGRGGRMGNQNGGGGGGFQDNRFLNNQNEDDFGGMGRGMDMGGRGGRGGMDMGGRGGRGGMPGGPGGRRFDDMDGGPGGKRG